MYGCDDPRVARYIEQQLFFYPDQAATTCLVGYALLISSGISYLAEHGMLV